jgi:flagellar hook-length control protein FliK
MGPATANPPLERAEGGGVPEAANRFVRAATLASEGTAQRINVLMHDDQLGRISLRMVDRAGLIQAVVRTEGGRVAQMLSDSLPALIESLGQRGLSAASTAEQGQGYEQQPDSRHGQQRRQRHAGGQSSGGGGRRPGRPAETVFQVNVR